MPQANEILALVQRRQRILKNARLIDAGHKRPGMEKGIPLAEAECQAEETEQQIRRFLVFKK